MTDVTLKVTLVIKSFRHKGLEDFFFDGSKKGIQPKHAQKLSYILDLLDSAKIVEDINFPGSDLHPLKGELKVFGPSEYPAIGGLYSHFMKVMHISLITLTTIRRDQR